MLPGELERLKVWFGRYVDSFGDMPPEDLRNIELKREHTLQVLGCMEQITSGEGLSPRDCMLASVIALLHDVGRFPQYRQWRTFRDSQSDNHARLSLEVIRTENLLQNFPETEQLQIEEAVRFHNLLEVPAQHRSPTDQFIKLIRDADKLDIWRVFLEYYTQPEHERASAAGLGFPDLPEVTPACLEALASGRIVMLDQARVLNDFKLLQISWVYDLNFPTTRRLVHTLHYIPRLAQTLPQAPDIQAAVNQALERLQTSCAFQQASPC